MSDEEKSSNKNYLWSAIISICMVGIARFFKPDIIPFDTFEFITMKTTPLSWLIAGIPIYIWGCIIQCIISLIYHIQNGSSSSKGPSTLKLLGASFLFSTWAGFAEEICFRWLIFFGAIVSVKIFNFLFFGFLGFGIGEWLHVNIFGHIADWATLGFLHDQLYSKSGWAVGAAMLMANAAFRDGHKYQGWFGILNSWFLGMFFFWMLFTHGLLAAILVHALYDIIVFTIGILGYKISTALS